MSSSRLSLLWWLPEYPPDPGGIATFAGHLVPGLAARGHEVTAFVTRGETDVSHPTERLEVRREPFRETFESGDPRGMLALRRTTNEAKQRATADLYHVHLCEPSPMLHLATLDIAPAPTVLTMHNEIISGFDPDDPDSLTTRLFATSKVVTCVSTTATKAFAGLASRFNHRLVPIVNGVPLPERTSPPPVEPRIVAIGRLSGQKGFDRLLRSMPAIIEAVPEVRLEILGDGPERSALDDLVTSLGLGDHVVLRGHVDRSEVATTIDRSRVVVAPSRYEGLPYVALEASGHGRPIIATDVAGIDEVVVDGVTGVALDKDRIDDDPQLLADAVIRLLADHESCVEMGRAGRERTARLFSIDACLDAYEHVYRAATQRRCELSVIIPVYNGERHLGAAVESALAAIAHAEVDAQVIVVDDGSTDASLDIARSFADRGVEVFAQPNLGGGLARNTGTALTNSEWIAHLDADDMWPVGRVRALLDAAADAGPTIEAVYGRAVEFADADAPPSAMVDTAPAAVRVETAAIIRRSTYDRVGGHSASGKNDQLEWATNAIDCGLTYVSIDDVTLERRIHASNMSHDRPFVDDTSRVALIRAHLERMRQR